MIIYEPTPDEPAKAIVTEIKKVIDDLDGDYNLTFENGSGQQFFYVNELLDITREEAVEYESLLISDACDTWLGSLDDDASICID